ncbi:MAG TPA: AMP-binding protein [Planctomycetaceae bacterium]|nr:AMP-binding protein [Planctomycetaceae bacterium]
MGSASSDFLTPPRRFLRMCKRQRFQPKVADSTGMELTGGKLLTASLVVKRVLERGVIAADEPMVGILLPPSVAGVIANTAVSFLNRVAVNLNYTLSQEHMDSCARQANLRHVITSRRVLEKFPFRFDAELVYLEDLKEKATRWDKLAALTGALVLPAWMLERQLGLDRTAADDLLTVIFTSGSTGEPKGVILSHRNIGSNIDAVQQSVHIRPDDVLLGVLPFFHSFGFTATLWLVLGLGPKGVYHFDPRDGRTVGKLCEKHGVTILMATPTFLRMYQRRCTPEQLSKLNLVIVGAEKLPLDLARDFKQALGVEPSEGYGATETGPVVAVNIPDDRYEGPGRGTKLGTVGRPLPGVSARVVSPETGEELGRNREGLLWVTGPNIMRGYLNQPEKTAEVIRDGWYNTGDMAKLDDEGFIEITGRESRFSKIGGEMVPHLKIEEALERILSDGSTDEPEVMVAVTAVPHETKGERLVVLHKPVSKPVSQIVRELQAAGLPNLWIPSQDSFFEVSAIPLLGTGKLDLRAVRQLALEKCGHT